MTTAAPPSRRRRPKARPRKDGKARRTRSRGEGIRFSAERKRGIAQRVIDFATRDREERKTDSQLRLQRYAKLRMWTENSGDFPWPDSSDFGLPDMATDSMRTQDTLQNAFMTHRPAIVAKSTRKDDEENERTVDELIDHQVFVEQPGEVALEEAAESFVNDGSYVIYIPWVRERRPVSWPLFFPKIPEVAEPSEYFQQLLEQEFPQHQLLRRDEEGWDWEVIRGAESFNVSFYTEPKSEKVRMVVDRVQTVFDGPKFMVKDYNDVLYPWRSANLQPPGPANPGGASHVILVDRITLDELRKGQRNGTYNTLTQKLLDELEGVRQDKNDDDEVQEQKDDLAGGSHDPLHKPETRSHQLYTLYTCFDRFDIDGDGLDEDVVWRVVKELKILASAGHMTEEFPLDPPRRPLAEASFLPVKGRREGISLPELMESTHDLIKTLWDQMLDAGTLANTPFGFYRPTSSIKPEVIRLFPGELYPLNDPARDVAFPNIANPGQAFFINTIGIADTMQQKLTLQGDLAFGRIPTGKSSALRTSGGINAVLAQGEARPERILRRFFQGWVQAWRIAHQLNQHYLQPGKRFRIVGWKPQGSDPYRHFASRSMIDGDFLFEFQANVANSSKVALQDALERAMAMVASPLAIQLGIATPDKLYKLLFDAVRAIGLEPDLYLNAPDPERQGPRILAEEAMTDLLMGRGVPTGVPLEPGGWNEHLGKLLEFQQNPEIQAEIQAHPELAPAIDAYTQRVAEEAQAERQRLASANAAAQGQTNGSGTPGPDAQQSPDLRQPLVNENELLDESLAGAGGGAQA